MTRQQAIQFIADEMEYPVEVMEAFGVLDALGITAEEMAFLNCQHLNATIVQEAEVNNVWHCPDCGDVWNTPK